MIFQDGKKEEGMWKNDVRHGWFKNISPQGEVTECLWNEGKIMNSQQV
jgi:hypothetical protein